MTRKICIGFNKLFYLYSDSRFLSSQIKMTQIHNIYNDSLEQVGAVSC